MSQRTNQRAPTVSGQAIRKGRRKRLAGKEEDAHLPVHSDALAQRQPATMGQRLPLEERQAVVTSTGTLVGNRQLQKQLSATVVQTQAAPAVAPAPGTVAITEADKAEFALLKNRIADADVTAYVTHRNQVFGSTTDYLAYAAVADAELDNTKGLRARVELRNNPAAQTILYRWLRKAYETQAGVSDVPGLIKQGMTKELKTAIEEVKKKFSKTFSYGGFNPRPMKNAKKRFRLGTVSQHALGKAVDIEAGKNPILAKADWKFIEMLTGKTVDRKKERWQKQPEELWKDVNDLNQRFVEKVKQEVERIEKERAAAGMVADSKTKSSKKVQEPIDEIFAKHKPLKKWKDGFFTLDWALVKALHENGFVWGATFGNAVALHHFEL